MCKENYIGIYGIWSYDTPQVCHGLPVGWARFCDQDFVTACVIGQKFVVGLGKDGTG